MIRLISFFVAAISVIFFPVWFSLSVFVVLASFFHRFWEGVLIGVVFDSLYFSPVLFSKFHLGFFTISSILVILFMECAKYFIQGRNFLSKLLIAASGGLLFCLLFFLFT